MEQVYVLNNKTTASSANQTNGTQKTQIVTSGGTTIDSFGAGTTTTSTQSSVANSITSVTLLASNSSRKSATIYNDDSVASLYVKFGTPASSTNFKIKIPPNGYYEFPLPIYTGQVDGIATAATGNARVCEET